MKKKITSAIAAASLAGGIAIGGFVAPPMSAFATDSSTPATAATTARTPGQWITDSLKGLVDNGTINQAQSDSIAQTLKNAVPKGGPGGHGHGGGMGLAEAAKVLGVSESDLRTQTETKSLADIAKEKNVDVQKVIDALVTAQNTRIDQQVTDGHLTQVQADQRKANTVQRVTSEVSMVHAGHGPRPSGQTPMDPAATPAAPAPVS